MIGAIYARVSSKPQAEESGFDRQIENGRKVLEEMGAVVPDDLVFREIISAAKVPYAKRLVFCKVMELAKSGAFETLYVDEASRLSRSDEITEAAAMVSVMKRFGVTVIIPNMPDPSSQLGMLFLTLQGYISSYENNVRTLRTMPGKRLAAEKGRIPNGFGPAKGPFGMFKDKQAMKLRWISPEHKETVRWMLTSYVEEGKSSSAITRRAKRKGNTSRYGWSLAS